MLVRLLYASRMAERHTVETVNRILAKSQTNNLRHGITGVLCYGDDIFLQVLEGGRNAVNELYGTILKDERHKEVILLQYEEIPERKFSNWTMGSVNLAKINPAVVLKYSDFPTLNPYAVSGRVSIALIEELSALASVVGHLREGESKRPWLAG